MALFTVDASELEGFRKIMSDYGDNGLRAINDVLHNEGADEIRRNIMDIIPASGRTWKGKKREAKSAQPFSQKKELLSVTTQSKGSYHYLYFPDDGSNTKRHYGNQQFMRRGAEASADKIIETCLGRLTEGF